MAGLTIIGIVIYIIYYFSKKKPTYSNTHNPKEKNTQYSDRKVEQQSISNFENTKLQITTSNNYNHDDPSIIDVTNQSSKIYPDNYLQKYANRVPFWVHHYVYSYSEINSASSEQKNFYLIFKNSFLKGEYIDLEGNSNYAFILLFDLLREYDSHQDITKLEKQLRVLGQNYPKTKPYADSFLKQKRERYGNNGGFSRLWDENRFNNQDQYRYYDDWKLGNKYKVPLKLNNDEVTLLNRLWSPNNNFCSIEYCCKEILKLYLAVISELKNKYIETESTIDSEFLAVADIIAKKHFKYRKGSQSYKYCIETTTNELYSYIFKYCENAVREYYGHKRKINTDTYYTSTEAKAAFDTKIISKVEELLPLLLSRVSLPDEATDIELYAQNTSRWKIRFDILTTNYNDKPKAFIESIVLLGKLNKNNPSVENIFYEASKFIAKYDKESALHLYVHYLYHDLRSVSFDNKQFTKTIQKSLFKTNEQLNDFEKIVSELITNRDLDKALSSIPKIYEVKRKKIQLDTATIKEVQKQHSGTVELLNEYLNDDFDGEENKINSQEISNEEIKIEIIQKNENVTHSGFLAELELKPIHITTLELFAKSNFALPQSEIEVFAKSNGIFRNQLIESINDACYEFLDDILIEEEDNFYTINNTYFQRISTK